MNQVLMPQAQPEDPIFLNSVPAPDFGPSGTRSILCITSAGWCPDRGYQSCCTH